MRELILKMSISVDGFVSDLAGRNDWMFGNDQEAKAWSVDILSNAGLHIMGSRTFEGMAAHWPTATGPFATAMNGIPKAVFSRRGAAILSAVPAGGAGNWGQAHVATGDVSEEVSRLKAEAGAPILAHGGAAFARSLVARALVDRYVLLVCPVALGCGLPIFSDLAAPAALALQSSRAFPGGAVAQVYRPA